jgi:hypothetical protein
VSILESRYVRTRLAIYSGPLNTKPNSPDRSRPGSRERSPFSLEHRGYVLSSIIASVAFLEAMINELFQDAADGHAPEPFGYITPLSEECRRTMAEVWAITRGGRVPALEKFDSPSCGASALLCSTERATWSRTPKPRLTCGIDLSTFDPRIGPQRTRLTRWSASVGSSPISPHGWLWEPVVAGQGARSRSRGLGASLGQVSCRSRFGCGGDRAELPEVGGRRMRTGAWSANALMGEGQHSDDRARRAARAPGARQCPGMDCSSSRRRPDEQARRSA